LRSPEPSSSAPFYNQTVSDQILYIPPPPSHLLTQIDSQHTVTTAKKGTSLLKICLIFVGVILFFVLVALTSLAVLYSLRTSSTSDTTATTSTTTLTTTSQYECSNFTVVVNYDYPNNDIANALPMTYAVCCAWCLDTATCTTFAYIVSTSRCWIKTSIGTGGGVSVGTIGVHM
ncbi:unnamed protein product, partial [Didymodactylos carnosus]